MEAKSLDTKNEIRQKLERYQFFLLHDPQNILLTMDTIQLALSLDDFETAKTLVDNQYPNCQDSPEFNALGGHILLQMGHFDEALTLLRNAMDLRFNPPAVLLDLAHVYHYLHQPESALAVLIEHEKQLAGCEPAIFYPLYARLLYLTDRSESAIEQLDFFHAHHESTPESAGLLSLMLYENDESADKVIRLANEALGKNPKTLEALVARAFAHLDTDQYNEALADGMKAAEYHPLNGRAWSCLAQVEFINLQMENARDAASKAVIYMKDHIGTWHLLGWSHLLLNEANSALTAFQQSYDLDRGFPETHGGLAATYAHLGEREKATHHIKLATKLDPQSQGAIYARMVLASKSQEMQKANELLTTLLSSFKKSKNVKRMIDKRLAEFTQSDKETSRH